MSLFSLIKRSPPPIQPAIVTVDDWLQSTGGGRRDADFKYTSSLGTKMVQCHLCAWFDNSTSASAIGEGKTTAEAFHAALAKIGRLVTANTWRP